MPKITFLENGDRASLKIFYVFYSSGNTLTATFNPPPNGEQYTRVAAINADLAIQKVKDQKLHECLINAI